MSSDTYNDHESGNIHFGRVLKFWRNVYKVSQEELALRIDSAARHISRLEKGKAHPGKDMVLRIAEALGLHTRDTVNLLFSAGFVDFTPSMDISSPELAYRREEIILGLKALEPNPAVAINITGNIAMVNRPWVRFQQILDSEEELTSTSNIFDFLIGYAQKTSLPQEWEGTFSVLMLMFQQWQYFHGDDNKEISKLVQRLQASSYVPDNWQRTAAERQPGQKFKVNTLIDGNAQCFLVHSYIDNLLGPLAFSTPPDLIVMAFCAENDNLDLSSFMCSEANHPLLYY